MFSGATGSQSCRCESCNVNWPHFMNSARACPICHDTTHLIGETPISATAALDLIKANDARLQRYAEFEEFYVGRELRELAAGIERWEHGDAA